MMMINERFVGLYVHIPFCVKKCAYCDFYSQTDYSLTDAYVSALMLEARTVAKANPDMVIDTLYIGGGTPSSLSAEQLDRVLGDLKKIFSVRSDAEITLEVNPATLDEEKLDVLERYGVTRISMGLQSASNEELCRLSRIHTYEQFEKTYFLVKGRIPQISLDLMFGLPNQTLDTLTDTLHKAISLSPDHISLYALKIEEGTPFALIENTLSLPDDDEVADMYLMACEMLEKAGYLQYEISNFARQGCLSRHNYRYWKREEYIGLGPGAHSFFNGVRYANLRDIHGYVSALHSGCLPPKSENSVISHYEAFCEAIMLGLRLREGVDLEYLFSQYGYAMGKPLLKKIKAFVAEGYATSSDGRLSLTPRGFLVSNGIIGEILPDER